jgi:GTPase SAR1 family protein
MLEVTMRKERPMKLGVLGDSGAGKTTLTEMLRGVKTGTRRGGMR